MLRSCTAALDQQASPSPATTISLAPPAAAALAVAVVAAATSAGAPPSTANSPTTSSPSPIPSRPTRRPPHHRLVLCISSRAPPRRSSRAPCSPLSPSSPPATPVVKRPPQPRRIGRYHPYHMMASPSPALASAPPLPRSSRAASRRTTLLSPLSTTPSGGPSRSLDPTGTLGPVAVEIVPGVYLGDLAAAESAPVLASLGITHVLSAMRGVVRLPPVPACAHHQFPIEDNPFAELAAHLPAATAFVESALKERPDARVLVHCVQGVSRSAAVVAAYLVTHFGWPVDRAVAHIKSCRPVADPNFGFIKQIGEYAETLKSGPGS